MSAEHRPGAGVPRRRGQRVAGWAAAGLLVLQLGWLLVMPPATGIDEFDHVLRASAVTNGNWQPASERLPDIFARGGLLPVRSDIAAAVGPACARLPYTRPFNCRPYRQIGHGLVEIASGVDTYNPSYYAVAGNLARPFKGDWAIYALRVITAAASTAMFAWAVYLTTSWARTRWPVALLIVGCLPTTVYSTSVAAPNGPQMVSGILVWSALVTLLKATDDDRSSAYWGLMVGVAVMANTHTLGLFWLGLIGITLVVYLGVSASFKLLLPRGRLELVALMFGIASVLFELLWLIYARPNVSQPEGGGSGNPWTQIVWGVFLWPLQAIAAFPYRNESAPGAVYAIALSVLGCITVLVVRALRGRRRLVRATLVAALLTATVPIAITYAGFHQFGMSWQGRYNMPFSVGLMVIAGAALDARGPGLRGLPLGIAGSAWGLAQTLSLTGVLHKQLKDHHLIAATGWRSPSVVLVVALGVTATAAWLRCVRVSASADPPEAPARHDRLLPGPARDRLRGR